MRTTRCLERKWATQSSTSSIALSRGHTACARLLLENGAETGLAVWAAARQGHFEVARLLVAYGAELDKPASDGSSPVKAARAAGYDDVADMLVDAGARDGPLLASFKHHF